MHYYFAPLEGLTDVFYRRLHYKYFGGVDRYYMPFISPTMHKNLTTKENRDLPMADSVPFEAIPQVLTKVPEDFLWAAQQCQDRGYQQVNLNVGCPSGTVVAKGKGAGMLADPKALDRFLDTVFNQSPLPISVKTRLGMAEPAEFAALLEVFNRYPIQELIIHPRVRKAFYRGGVHMDSFRDALKTSKNPLCYNGNLCSLSQIRSFSTEFPQVDAIMIGRGLIDDPGMLVSGGTTAERLEVFLEELLEVYTAEFGSARNAMFRLKENWGFLIHKFENSEKLWKRLRKTTHLDEYKSITAEIFHTLPLRPELNSSW